MTKIEKTNHTLYTVACNLRQLQLYLMIVLQSLMTAIADVILIVMTGTQMKL